MDGLTACGRGRGQGKGARGGLRGPCSSFKNAAGCHLCIGKLDIEGAVTRLEFVPEEVRHVLVPVHLYSSGMQGSTGHEERGERTFLPSGHLVEVAKFLDVRKTTVSVSCMISDGLVNF